MEKSYVNGSFPRLIHGGDYNPEQWINTPEIWDEDMRLMKEAALNEMTVGIFSWSTLEPEEDKYDFSFLDTIIDKISRAGGKVILATPSGARPRWLAEKYPEVLRVNCDGERMHFEARHNHCPSSPVYREKVRKINTELAKRYGKNKAVIAWHVSNEYGGECFCPLCAAAFREYLRKEYGGNIEKLNFAYWSRFWSHNYTSFDEIEPPMKLTERGLHGLNLDWRRFVSAQTVDFMKNEIAPLKEICPDIPVTTNMMYGYGGLNYSDFAEVIDFASWDSYPEWHTGDDEKTAQENAFWHDFFRTLKGKPFFMMESTPSLVNWKSYNKLKRPGMDNLSSLQAVAHGSDGVGYFQFRKSRGGAEKFHGAVVDHVGSADTRVFGAVRRTGEILEKLSEIAGTRTPSDVAVIFDWENMWALSDAQGFVKDDKKYYDTCYEYHKIFWKRGINCDVVSPHADLSGYKLVIAPMQYMTDAKTEDNFEKYVRGGGTLYATYMLGMVDGTDLCHLGGFPGGKLGDVFGIWNEEIDTLMPGEINTVVMGKKTYAAHDYCEAIHTRGADVLATYKSGIFSGMPAVTKNGYGSGTAVYQAFRDDGALASEIIDEIVKKLGITGGVPCKKGTLPSGVSAHTRVGGENEYLFVENYSEKQWKIDLGGEFTDMLTGKTEKTANLSAYGFFVGKRKI